MCSEGNLSPKTSYFINVKAQELVRIEEFSGKIQAAKDTQKDMKFCLVVRIKAFIMG